MNRQEVLISRALNKARLSSYGALAKKMGVSAATMSQWRSGTSKLSDERITELSELAGDDPGVWLLAMMAEECNIGPLRKSLERIVTKVGKGVAMALALGVATLPLPESAKASKIQQLSEAKGHGMYIMFKAQQGAAALPASVGVPN